MEELEKRNKFAHIELKTQSIPKCKSCKANLINGMLKCTKCLGIFCDSCSKECKLEIICQKKVDSIPEETFNSNFYEMQILKDYITQNKKEIQEIYNEQINKPKYQSCREDLICKSCFLAFWSNLLYAYRLENTCFLPKEITERPNCSFGRGCMSQNHNSEHARKFNHVCEKKR